MVSRAIMLRQFLKPRALVEVGSQRFKSSARSSELKTTYDAIVIGGGHNGLVAAAYLQKSGLDVCVLERRHVLGGAAVTEELIPGFKFSRASYVLSLLRPTIIKDLELKDCSSSESDILNVAMSLMMKHGLKFLIRDPSSYTPILDRKDRSRQRSLTLGRDAAENTRQIAQFSSTDAKAYVEYEHMLNRIVDALNPLLDVSPVHLPTWLNRDVSFRAKWSNLPSLKALITLGRLLGKDLISFYEFMTAPAAKILDAWFESEPLKATLATDAVIGAMVSPKMPGSAYVLLHHVMGEIDGCKGAWAYVEGGMGAVSESIASAAKSHGASIFTEKPVQNIIVGTGNRAEGVVLQDGTEIRSKLVLSNATAKVTFLDLLVAQAAEESQGLGRMKIFVFASELALLPNSTISDRDKCANNFCLSRLRPATIGIVSIAVNQLPNFIANPNLRGSEAMPHHRGTIHLNSENMDMIHEAYTDAVNGRYSAKAVIEMTIPSSLDSTVAPPGCHVVQLFTQYTPYSLADGEWTEERKTEYADRLFDDIELYAPGFKSSVVGRDILTPPDIERIFGLTGGNIFHGAISADQLYSFRPTPQYSNYQTPVSGLFLCGSGTHPGGGVMGAPGRLAALASLKHWKK